MPLHGRGIGHTKQQVVTQWQPPYRMFYDFEISPDSIPRDALDRHVEIGGEYFDIVSGGYTIRPLSDGRSEVTLQTTYANRSSLKLYGDLWGDFVFGDFHQSILRLIKHRAERQS